jgi:hypothetical protein
MAESGACRSADPPIRTIYSLSGPDDTIAETGAKAVEGVRNVHADAA